MLVGKNAAASGQYQTQGKNAHNQWMPYMFHFFAPRINIDKN
jgi:hypothetical protein